MSVYIDVTEFLASPLRSGIQRVVAQICRNWPDGSLVPVRFERDKLVVLSRQLIGDIERHFEQSRAASLLAFRFAMAKTWRARAPLILKDEDTLLVPEVFYDLERLAYYSALSEKTIARCRFILYDLTPIEYPEFFPDAQYDAICAYFQMIRRVAHCGFISQATQRAYCHRLLRLGDLSGVVFRLGSDGLGPRPASARRCPSLTFTVVGRIEPSKNPDVVLEAFEPLLQQIPGMRLILIGAIGHMRPSFSDKLKRMAADPASGVSHYSNASDELIRTHVDASRATIFVSGAEGFGLPPVESLWRGIPVIASAKIPSLETIGSMGVDLVEPLTVPRLRNAVRAFLDDEYAMRKSEEAMALELPTWQGFTSEVAAWCAPDGPYGDGMIAQPSRKLLMKAFRMSQAQ
ncbi:MAG: glycosyltransferase [Bryobacteraceae bacterium]